MYDGHCVFMRHKLRTLSSFEKYETNIDDVGGRRKYSCNKVQWSKK